MGSGQPDAPVCGGAIDVSGSAGSPRRIGDGGNHSTRAEQPERDRSESAIRTGLFARLALIAAVAYQLLLIGLILLRPEIDPARKPISEYAIGRLGWLAVLAFQVSATAYACLVVAPRPMLRDRLGRIGLVVLCYCAVATVVVGLCVADPVTTPID